MFPHKKYSLIYHMDIKNTLTDFLSVMGIIYNKCKIHEPFFYGPQLYTLYTDCRKSRARDRSESSWQGSALFHMALQYLAFRWESGLVWEGPHSSLCWVLR